MSKENLTMAILMNTSHYSLQQRGTHEHQRKRWGEVKQEKKKRKYYRKCGICGERHEQSEMIRTDNSPNGWICFDCHNSEHP